MQRLINFYDPIIRGPDAQGRTLDEILSWSDARLESSHNYIQTLFPLPEESDFSFDAPVVDEEAMLFFRSSDALKRNLMRATKRMLSFYGFDARDGDSVDELTITPLPTGFSHWLTRFDHNHLRITRMLRSLRLLGLEKVAADFHDALVAAHDARGVIGDRTLGYWERAVGRPLWEAPDGTEVHWLKKYD